MDFISSESGRASGGEFEGGGVQWPPEKSILKTFESVWKWHESKANLNKFVGLHSTSPSNPLAQPDLLSSQVCGGYSVTQLCLTLCDPMDCSLLGLPVLHYLPEFAQTHAH